MESGGGLLGGLESTPKKVLQNFLGVNYLLRGSNSPDPPSNTTLVRRIVTLILALLTWRQPEERLPQHIHKFTSVDREASLCLEMQRWSRWHTTENSATRKTGANFWLMFNRCRVLHRTIQYQQETGTKNCRISHKLKLQVHVIKRVCTLKSGRAQQTGNRILGVEFSPPFSEQCVAGLRHDAGQTTETKPSRLAVPPLALFAFMLSLVASVAHVWKLGSCAIVPSATAYSTRGAPCTWISK